MALNKQRDLQRPGRLVSGGGAAVALCLLSILAVRSEGQGTRPSEHGLAYEQEPGPASTAMAAFFHARPEAALPQASNFSVPSLSSATPTPRKSAERDRPRPALLAAGVVCGVLVLALLVASALAYVARVRRSDSDSDSGSTSALVRGKSGREIRLGTA